MYKEFADGNKRCLLKRFKSTGKSSRAAAGFLGERGSSWNILGNFAVFSLQLCLSTLTVCGKAKGHYGNTTYQERAANRRSCPGARVLDERGWRGSPLSRPYFECFATRCPLGWCHFAVTHGGGRSHSSWPPSRKFQSGVARTESASRRGSPGNGQQFLGIGTAQAGIHRRRARRLQAAQLNPP